MNSQYLHNKQNKFEFTIFRMVNDALKYSNGTKAEIVIKKINR